MAGMSKGSRALPGRWGGTGDGTNAEVRRQVRRAEDRLVAQDIADDLAPEDSSGSYWDYDDPRIEDD